MTAAVPALAPLQSWPAELSARLGALERLDPTTPAGWYLEEFELGRLELMTFGPRGWVLWRGEQTPAGAELVIVAAVSDPRAGDHLARLALPELEAWARRQGFQSIRLHTSRAGLVAIASEAGWTVAEHVLRKALTRGR